MLSPTQQRRLEKLARDAGRTPQAMLRFVLRDGFDYCDYVVKATNEGLRILRGEAKTFSTKEVLSHARGVLEKT